jgi:hypothetical protein
MNDMYLALDGDPKSKEMKQQMHLSRKRIAFYLFISLAVSIPISCGLYKVSNSIDEANMTDLSKNINNINGNFEYIKSVDSNLETISSVLEKFKEEYDMDQIDELLLKLNYTLDRLIYILEHIPIPPESDQVNPINQVNPMNQKVF